MTQTVLVVTDPMCSWCWGMVPALETARAELGDQVQWQVALGGINVDSKNPVGRFGAARLMDLWREVSETTGQTFGYRLPDGLVYNSRAACCAVEAVRRLAPESTLDYVHRLQQAFFVDAADVSRRDVQSDLAQPLGITRRAFNDLVDSELVDAAVARQMATSRIYGTQALPNLVLAEAAGAPGSLLLGGYADAKTIVSSISAALGPMADGAAQ